MRTSGSVPALIATICIFCAACGCLGAAPLPTGGGITPIDLPEPPAASTLAGALAELDLLGAEGGLNVAGASVHQVLGTGVDIDGQAASWALGLQDGEEIRWLTYGPAGWQEISLPAPLPADEVRIADILSPEDLLRGREDMFRPVMERLGADTVDLALAGGVYSVTIRSDAGMETLSFEADTGEVIA